MVNGCFPKLKPFMAKQREVQKKMMDNVEVGNRILLPHIQPNGFVLIPRDIETTSYEFEK